MFLVSPVCFASGGLPKFKVDASGNVSPPGSLTLTTPASLFVNCTASLICSLAVPTFVTGTTYQEFLQLAYDTGPSLYGGVLGTVRWLIKQHLQHLVCCLEEW